MSNLEKLMAVQQHPVMAYAFRSACNFRQLSEKDLTVSGKRVGKYHFNATLNMIARIVYEGHNETT